MKLEIIWQPWIQRADSAEAAAANRSCCIYFTSIRRVQYDWFDDNDESRIYIHSEIKRIHPGLQFDGLVAQRCTTWAGGGCNGASDALEKQPNALM